MAASAPGIESKASHQPAPLGRNLVLISVFLLTTASAALALPDLSPWASPAGFSLFDDITFSSTPVAGQPVDVYVTVHNYGADPITAGSPAPIQVTLTTSPFVTVIGTQEVPTGTTLNPGDSYPFTFTWTPQAASTQLFARTDPASLVTESNETNNQARAPVITGPLPDLSTWDTQATATGSDITFSSPPVAGQPVDVYVTVHNYGAGAVTSGSPAPIQVRLRVFPAASTFAIQDLPNGTTLNPGDFYTVTFHWTADATVTQMQGASDPSGVINESDESNNNTVVSVTVAPAPTTTTTTSTTSTTQEPTTTSTSSTTSTTEEPTTTTIASTTSTTESTTTSTTTTSTSTTELPTSTTETSTSTTTSTTQPAAAACGPVPATGCRLATPLKSSVTLTDSPTPGKDAFKWAWKGAATGFDAFKDPLNATPVLRVCVYDASGSPQPLAQSDIPAGGTCGTKPCWKLLGRPTNPKGYKYKDKSALTNGWTDAQLKAGDDGEAKVSLKGKGDLLHLPPLALTLPVTVQLLIGDESGTACWQTTYPTAKKNTAASFQAKGP